MKKSIKTFVVFLIIWAIGTIAFFSFISIFGRGRYNGKYPTDKTNTFWASEIPKGYFIADENKGLLNIGTADNEEIAEFSLFFLYDRIQVRIADNENNQKINGRCKFLKKKFTIVVTDSTIDSIKAGDKIVFNQVDKLPNGYFDEGKEPTVNVPGWQDPLPSKFFGKEN